MCRPEVWNMPRSGYSEKRFIITYYTLYAHITITIMGFSTIGLNQITPPRATTAVQIGKSLLIIKYSQYYGVCTVRCRLETHSS